MAFKPGTGRRGPWWRAAGVLVAVASGTWAAAAQVTPSMFQGTVTVGRTAGGTVRGTIKACTPELLTLDPVAKPKADAAADLVAVPWAEVRSVSNGLTYRAVLDAWKAQHRDRLCPDCRGERTVACPTCKGTAHDPAAAADCKTCHGELLVACKSPGEADGQVACPNACLRPGVGPWAKGQGGQMWRTFPLGGGRSMSFSEHHVGDVIVIDAKNHTATDAGKCPICGGTLKVDDPACHGTGKVPCPECSARRSAAACPDHCKAGRIECPTCHGTGERTG